MPGPYSLTNDWMMESSLAPAACICAIFSLAGFEKWHSSMLHDATESGHPHWHLMCAATRRVSRLGFSLAVCASAAATSSAAKTTRRISDVRRLRSARQLAHHFGARVLHLDLGRDQAGQRAADQHQRPHPDPAHQREHVGLDHGALVIVAHAAEIQV